MQIDFTNLLIVAAAAFAAPLALGLVPSLRLPAVVLEIVLGIVLGPSVLDWAKVDEPVQLMSLLGLLWEGRLDTGQIRYDNGHLYDYARLSHVDRARLRLVEFGFVLQSAYLLPHFSCGRNIALPLELNGQPPTAARQDRSAPPRSRRGERNPSDAPLTPCTLQSDVPGGR